MSEITVGSVGVDVVPDARQFPRRLAAQVNPEAQKIGAEFGRLFGSAARERMADGVRDGLRDGGRTVRSQATSAGNEYGGSFARTLKARLEAALRNLPEVVIDADAGPAQREIADVRARLESLRDAHVGVDVDAAAASAEVERLLGRLQRLSAESPEVSVRVDAGAASAELARFGAEVSRLDGRSVNVQVDADTAGASAQLALFQGQASGATGSVSGLVAAAALLGPALIPAGAAAVGAFGAIAAGAAAALSAVGVLALALAPVIGAIQAVRSANEQSAGAARQSSAAHAGLASAMASVEAAQRRVASAQEDARIQRIRAVEQIQVAELGLARAQQQAARDQEAALARIADAERTLADAQRDSLAAQRALEDARRQAVQDAQDLAARVANGALDERDAVLRVQEARERLAEVQADPSATDIERQRAQLALDQALQGLADQQRENARLRAEQEETARKGVEGSDRVVSAQERVRQAQERVREAQAGVAAAVADAARRQTEAADRVADAQRRVADATRDSADQQRRSAEAIVSAQEAVVNAQRSVQQASQRAGDAGGTAMETARSKLAALTPAGREFASFVTGTLIPALKPLTNAAQAGFLPGLQTALTALLPVIPSISRFVGVLASTMGDLAVEAAKSLGDPVWQRFFDYLSGAAGPILVSIARSVGNFAKGFAGLIPAFAPVTDLFFKGLEGLSKAFADFGAGASSNSGFQRFIGYIQDVGPKIVATFSSVVQAVGHVLAALAPFGGVILDAIKGVADFIAGLKPAVIRGIALALGAVAIAAGVTNAALALLGANPIVLIVVGIVAAFVALGVAFYELYQRNETFRTIVQTVWAAVQTAISFAWNSVIKPTFEAVSGFVTDTLIPAFQTHLLPILRAVWSGIQVAISVAWAVIKAIFVAVRAYITGFMAPVFLWLWRNVITPAWTGIRIAISIAWALIKVIFGLIQIYIKAVLAPIFFWLWHNVIEPAWNGIKAAISFVWEKGIKPIFSALGNFISDHVAPAFRRGVDAIGAAWEKIRDKAKAPVRFVVDTIINKGIIGTFNKVAGYFGVDPVDTVTLPKGFATGGFVSGPGGPRDDKIPAWLSNGEFVINAEATRRNIELLKAINAGYDLGGDISGIARFANGGLVEQIKRWLPSVDPLPYRWGAVGPGAYDCSGLLGTVWGMLQGRPAPGHRYFTTSSNPRASGFAPGPGMFTMGVRPGVHMAGNLGGLGFEARSTRTGIFVGPSAKSVYSFPQVWHLTDLPGGAPPKGVSILNPIGSVKGMFSGILRQAHDLAVSPFGSIVAAIPGKLVDAALNSVGDALPGFAGGGLVTKYDQGGYLPPGLSTVLNATGKPEPVFTSDQFKRLRSGGGVTFGDLHFHNPAPEQPSESITRAARRVAVLPFGG